MNKKIVAEEDVWNELTNLKYELKKPSLSELIRTLLLFKQKYEKEFYKMVKEK